MFTISFMFMLRFDSQELHIDDITKIKKSKDGINDNYKDNWYKITDSNIKRLHSLVKIWGKYPKSLVLRIAITIDRKQLQSERSIKISRKKNQVTTIDFKNLFIKTWKCTKILWKVCASINCTELKALVPAENAQAQIKFADKAKTK